MRRKAFKTMTLRGDIMRKSTFTTVTLHVVLVTEMKSYILLFTISSSPLFRTAVARFVLSQIYRK